MTPTPPYSYTIGDLETGIYCCEPKALFQVRNLRIAYDQRTVLNDVSLDIYRGCITALIGPSGCGKSSFLSTLNKLYLLSATAEVQGQIFFDGNDILNTPQDLLALRRRVGMIFQKPNPFPLSIHRNLDLPLREHGVRSRKLREEKIEQALRDVGLWEEVKDRLDRPALAMSGGQQQRLCLARTLVLGPEVLLMDEPCSALDPLSTAVVEELIKQLQGRYTIIIVTHNLAQARRITNYAAFFWMKEQVGTLVEFGRSQQLFNTPQHYLTAAYVNGVSG